MNIKKIKSILILTNMLFLTLEVNTKCFKERPNSLDYNVLIVKNDYGKKNIPFTDIKIMQLLKLGFTSENIQRFSDEDIEFINSIDPNDKRNFSSNNPLTSYSNVNNFSLEKNREEVKDGGIIIKMIGLFKKGETKSSDFFKIYTIVNFSDDMMCGILRSYSYNYRKNAILSVVNSENVGIRAYPDSEISYPDFTLSVSFIENEYHIIGNDVIKEINTEKRVFLSGQDINYYDLTPSLGISVKLPELPDLERQYGFGYDLMKTNTNFEIQLTTNYYPTYDLHVNSTAFYSNLIYLRDSFTLNLLDLELINTEPYIKVNRIGFYEKKPNVVKSFITFSDLFDAKNDNLNTTGC